MLDRIDSGKKAGALWSRQGVHWATKIPQNFYSRGRIQSE
jgi:hypothetical protein